MANYLQRSTAGTGSTITFDSAGGDVHLTHDTTLAAAITLALPTSPIDGMKCYFVSVGGITALTMTASVGSILGGLTSVGANSPFCMMYSLAQNKWYKFG